MKIKNNEYRKLAHFIKYIEYYWSEYKKFPEEALTYEYCTEIETSIQLNNINN